MARVAEIIRDADVPLAAGLTAHPSVSGDRTVPAQRLHPAEHGAVTTTTLPGRCLWSWEGWVGSGKPGDDGVLLISEIGRAHV